MGKSQLLSVMHEAFKSLTIANIEIIELDGPLLKARVVAEKYASMDIPERIDLLTELLKAHSPETSLNYATSFEPLTPTEASERYGKNKSNQTSENDSNKRVAKSLDL